jgi:hypothetical protein
VILFSLIPIMYEGVSGVAESKASTASTPCKVACGRVEQIVDTFELCVSSVRPGLNFDTHENTVVSTGSTTSLSVSEGGNPGVQSKLVDEDVLDVVSLDRVEVLVERTLGDDDDRLSLSDLTVLDSRSRRGSKAN